MANFKGIVMAATVGVGLSMLGLSGCASEGSACGEAAAPAPAPVPAPVNQCKNANACKGHTGSGNSCSTH